MDEVREPPDIPLGLATREGVKDGELVDKVEDEEEVDHGQVDEQLVEGVARLVADQGDDRQHVAKDPCKISDVN